MWLHSRVTSPTILPYPLPETWRLGSAKREPWWRIALWTIIYLYGSFRMYVHLADGALGWALCMLVVSAVVGIAAVGEFWLAGGERGRPSLVNAVALTRAKVPPRDSWVHLFRDSEIPTIVVVGLFLVIGNLEVGAIWGLLVSVDAGGESGWFLLGFVPAALLGLLGLLAGVVLTLVDHRVGSFGRIPTGIAIGPSGLTLLSLDDPSDTEWSSIVRVEPSTVISAPTSGDFVAAVILETAAGEKHVPIGGMDAHAWLVYTAIRFWAEHPELRSELGTTYGQQRMISWHTAMHEAPSPPLDVGGGG